MKSVSLLVLLCAVFIFSATRSEAEDPKGTQNKAVLEISKTDGFKLAEKAIQTIGVTTKPVQINGEATLPKLALVHSLDLIAVYRLRNGWFKLVPVTLRKERGSMLTVRSPDLQLSDQIATQGVALLRASEMEAFGGGE